MNETRQPEMHELVQLKPNDVVLAKFSEDYSRAMIPEVNEKCTA